MAVPFLEQEKLFHYQVHEVESSRLTANEEEFFLPPKTLVRQKRLTIRNVLIITAFVLVYTTWVILATIPELYGGGFPFMSAAERQDWGGRTAQMGNPCTTWGVGGKFETTLNFGPFSYIMAKGLDALWNLVVGRGLQATLGWASYKLFAMAIMRVTQDTPISVVLYKDMVFAPTSPRNVPSLLAATWTARGWRGKIIFVWLVVAICYLLGFPTMLVSQNLRMNSTGLR